MPKPINTILLVLACLGMLAETVEAAQRSTKRVFRGPESILARACLEQGDLDGDQRLTQPEWQTLITGWKTALGFDEQERLSRPEFLKAWEALLDKQDHNSSTASNGMLPSRFLGFFVALDTNQDGWLSTLEFRDCMTRWFEAWQQGHVSLDATLLQTSWLQVLPMSNMSGAGMSHEREQPGNPSSCWQLPDGLWRLPWHGWFGPGSAGSSIAAVRVGHRFARPPDSHCASRSTGPHSCPGQKVCGARDPC